MGTGKKQKQAIMARPKPGKKKSMLQLKGRIFMQNVTDVISLARNGMYQSLEMLRFALTATRLVHPADFLEG